MFKVHRRRQSVKRRPADAVDSCEATCLFWQQAPLSRCVCTRLKCVRVPSPQQQAYLSRHNIISMVPSQTHPIGSFDGTYTKTFAQGHEAARTLWRRLYAAFLAGRSRQSYIPAALSRIEDGLAHTHPSPLSDFTPD